MEHSYVGTTLPRTAVGRDFPIGFRFTVPLTVRQTLHSPGQLHDADNRAYFQSRYGHDFSQVRLHADQPPEETPRAVRAAAYTVGSQIAFTEGRYQSGTVAGRRLLEHELAHVVQRCNASAPGTQLKVGKPSEAAERAADAAGQHPLVHPTTRTVDAIDASAPARTSASLTSAALFHEAVASPGEPLDEDTRAFMEPRFHHNFCNVRVHADMSSSQSAGRVNALAYTAGRDIVFAAGSYAPGTDSGRRLLAHELAHVVQQSSGPVDGALVTGGIKLSDPADRFEQEAELTAERVIAGRPATTRPGGNAPTSQSAGPALSVQRSNGSTPPPGATTCQSRGVSSTAAKPS